MPFGTTNQETPSQGEPFVIPSFGNVDPPFMATLSLSGLTIGLTIYLFSSSGIQVQWLFHIPTLHHKSINIMLIFHLLRQMCLLPFLLLFLLKFMMLVIMWIRRRRKGRLRRIKENYWPNTNQLLFLLRLLKYLPKQLVSQNSLARFVKMITL